MAKQIFCDRLLVPTGWVSDHVLTIADDGRIKSVRAANFSSGNWDTHCALVLPALSNVHSHAFQRSMAGMAERRGPTGSDDFWSWREIMYRFLDLLTPDDLESIAAFVQVELAEAGYAAQAEFHYIHNAPGGAEYEKRAETSLRHMAAAKQTGIGLTHLPVLYQYSGFDRGPLSGGQKRFGLSLEQFSRLFSILANARADMPDDFMLGVAPHSLRAVGPSGLERCIELAGGAPIHIHAAEQQKEVDECLGALGSRPVQWLLDNAPISDNWCLIHATHLDGQEVRGLAQSGAVVGLCPTTEGNLGDGIFPAKHLMQVGGKFGVGSDSHIRISVVEELRMLELSQRLHERQRVILADDDRPSVGKSIYLAAAKGGAQAIGRPSGEIREGLFADLVALDTSNPALVGLTDDALLDAWIFAAPEKPVHHLWSAGRHIVRDGRHISRDALETRYMKTMSHLRSII